MSVRSRVGKNWVFVFHNVPSVRGWTDRRALVNKATFAKGPPFALCFYRKLETRLKE